MKPREHRGYQQIREVYDMVPEMQCKGLCHDSCTSIDPSQLEQKVIQRRHGITFPSAREARQMVDNGETPPPCPALDPLNKCTIYTDRPLICRLYGADELLPCEHGCVPDSGLLAAEAGTEMIGVVDLISQDHVNNGPRVPRRRNGRKNGRRAH